MVPLRAGLVLSATVGVFYALCTLAWLAAPGPFTWFLNSLFHGIDFTPLIEPRSFSWPRFLLALLVLCVWALAAGAFYAWLHENVVRRRFRDLWRRP